MFGISKLRRDVEREVVRALPDLGIELLPTMDENAVDLRLATVHIRVFWEQGYYEAAFGPSDNLRAIFPSPDVLTCIGSSGETLASMHAARTVAALHSLLADRAADLVELFDPKRYPATRARLEAARRLRGYHYRTL